MLQFSSNQCPVQLEFINQYDGSAQSIVNFNRLHQIINVCFSAHYFYVSGTTDKNTVTTKNTDGSFGYWGGQTREQMDNAYSLQIEIKKELKAKGAYLIGNKYYLDIDGVPTRIKGMTAGNS